VEDIIIARLTCNYFLNRSAKNYCRPLSCSLVHQGSALWMLWSTVTKVYSLWVLSSLLVICTQF